MSFRTHKPHVLDGRTNIADCTLGKCFEQSSKTYNAAIDAVCAIISASPATTTTTSFPVLGGVGGGWLDRVNPRRAASNALVHPLRRHEREKHPHTYSAPRAARLTPVSFENPLYVPLSPRFTPTRRGHPRSAPGRSR